MNRLALIDQTTSLSYRQCLKIVQSYQSQLISFQTIALVPKRNIKTILFLLAAIRQGLSICLLSSRNPSHLNEKIARTVQATFLDPSDFFITKAQCVDLSYRCQFFIPTSGSTSKAKITILSYESMYLNALETIRKISLQPKDRYYLSLPLYHVGGLSILFRAILAKASLYIADKHETIDTVPANFASLVPTQLIRALPKKHKLREKYKCLLIGGAYLPPCVYNQAKDLSLYLTYGMSESASQILITKQPTLIGSNYYLGFPHRYCEMRLSSQKEIYIRGRSLFLGYVGQKPQTGWFATKDLGDFSSKFGYSFHKRKDRLFVSGGENIYPEEIERAIHSCALFDEVIVVPVEDLEFGKRAVAFIQGKNWESKKLSSELRRILPGYKVPIRFFNLSHYPSPSIKWSKGQLEKIAKKEIFSL